MESIDQLQKDVAEIKARNRKVEADKAWETSWTRRGLVAGLTYAVVVLFFVVADLANPFVNAIVPTMGFILSTLSVSVFKKWWIRKYHKNG